MSEVYLDQEQICTLSYEVHVVLALVDEGRYLQHGR